MFNIVGFPCIIVWLFSSFIFISNQSFFKILTIIYGVLVLNLQILKILVMNKVKFKI
jgi:hypothetical protein